MGRKIRVNEAGFHHVFNRGVEKRDIFLHSEDKDKFLDIVCEISLLYDFTVHSYVLMDNHYHILLENKRENLSDGMRRINSAYAQYFNKKYNRVGHLWQDRFKSWYILNDNYLLTLFRYIEANPIKAKLSKRFGEYNYTLLSDIFKNTLRECMKSSFIFDFYSDTQGLLDALNIPTSKSDNEILSLIKQESRVYKKTRNKPKKQYDLNRYFIKTKTKTQRNNEIKKAYQDGFSQSEIAKELNLSISSISKILKIQNSSPDPFVLIHTALFAEAKPLIERFKLQCSQKRPYRIYTKNHILLIVSGMGDKNALHVEGIFGKFKIKRAINIGIAGCRDENIEIGSLFCVNQKLDDIEFADITSVSKPLDDKKKLKTTLVDMECETFLDICKKRLDEENIFIFKVVSDYLDTTIPKKVFVEKLIKNSIKRWEKYV
jgi:REP element-mobilizing transposase RayT/DNA-binding CsgD family transcriptional regulator